MANQNVSVFTTAMRTEFINAYEEVAAPAEYLGYTTVIPSTARIEHYPWLSPTPAIDQYKGHRRVGKISEIMYNVPNLEYDSSFEVLTRDVKDDQTGGYLVKSRELAKKAQMFPGREALRHLSLGKTRKCFDGTAFFAGSHSIGTGNNLLTFDGTSNDATTHYLIALVTTGPVKPLIWQARQEPDLQNDLDTAISKFSKKARFWIDLEGAAAYGRWHDAIVVTITDTPSVTEIQTILGNVENRLRTFSLPTGVASDANATEYIHEQLVFTRETITFVVSSTLGNLMRQVLNQDTIVQSGAAVTNIYKGFGSLVVSGIVNTVS